MISANTFEIDIMKTETVKYFRLPKPGHTDPHFGGSRSWWNGKILPSENNDHQPPVKSVVDKRPGAKSGVRFIDFQSAMDYFTKLTIDQVGHVTTTNNRNGGNI